MRYYRPQEFERGRRETCGPTATESDPILECPRLGLTRTGRLVHSITVMVKHALIAIPVICVAAVLIGLAALAMKLSATGSRLFRRGV